MASQSELTRRAGQESCSTESARQLVEQHPISATMAAFGLGVGAGVAVAMLMSGPRHERDAGMAHRIGRQILDAVTNAVPERMTHFHR